jgi:hypothetical protein
VDLCREANPVGPRSQGPTTTHSGAYVEEENAASGAKTKRGALTSSGLRGNSTLMTVAARAFLSRTSRAAQCSNRTTYLRLRANSWLAQLDASSQLVPKSFSGQLAKSAKRLQCRAWRAVCSSAHRDVIRKISARALLAACRLQRQCPSAPGRCWCPSDDGCRPHAARCGSCAGRAR